MLNYMRATETSGPDVETAPHLPGIYLLSQEPWIDLYKPLSKTLAMPTVPSVSLLIA